MALWIKNPLALWHPGEEDTGGGLVVENHRIVELVRSGGTPTTPVTDVFDASELVLLPGLINTHHHFYQTLGDRQTEPCAAILPGVLSTVLFKGAKYAFELVGLNSNT